MGRGGRQNAKMMEFVISRSNNSSRLSCQKLLVVFYLLFLSPKFFLWLFLQTTVQICDAQALSGLECFYTNTLHNAAHFYILFFLFIIKFYSMWDFHFMYTLSRIVGDGCFFFLLFTDYIYTESSENEIKRRNRLIYS